MVELAPRGARPREAHGSARIEDYVHRQLGVAARLLHEELARPRVDAPVDPPRVVSGDVAPTVHELGSGPALRRRVQARERALRDDARARGEVGEPLEDLRVELHVEST